MTIIINQPNDYNAISTYLHLVEGRIYWFLIRKGEDTIHDNNYQRLDFANVRTSTKAIVKWFEDSEGKGWIVHCEGKSWKFTLNEQQIAEVVLNLLGNKNH